MNKKNNVIECPKCSFNIDVNELLYSQLKKEITKKYSDKTVKEMKSYKDKILLLEQEQKELNKRIQEGIETGLKAEKTRLKRELRKNITIEHKEELKMLNDELNQKNSQLIEHNKIKSLVEKLKREKAVLKEEIELDYEKRMNQEIKKIRKQEGERIELKIEEREHAINQLKKQLKEAQRKAEQVPVQVQGEVQEKSIQKFLIHKFPLDTIEPVGKGVKGADVVQIINTPLNKNCGIILIESKRTKSFNNQWISKFKNDMQEKGADLGILVTEVMPTNMKGFGLKEGIWICSYTDFKGLCFVLRQSLIQLNSVLISQKNKVDKMSILYNYLISTEFKLQIEAVVSGFTQMQQDLESEKRALNSVWKKREKQIQKVLMSTNNLYSSIKGIAGDEIQNVPMLEFSKDEDNSDK